MLGSRLLKIFIQRINGQMTGHTATQMNDEQTDREQYNALKKQYPYKIHFGVPKCLKLNKLKMIDLIDILQHNQECQVITC